jgi:hypothetical protein
MWNVFTQCREKHVCWSVCELFFMCIPAEVWSLFCTLSRNAPLFLSKWKLESILFAGIYLERLVLRYRSLKIGGPPHLEWPVSEYKVLKLLWNTPVKAKIKIITNTHFCVIICNLDHTAMLTDYCFCTINMLSLQIIQVKQPWSISNTEMFPAFNLPTAQ